MGQAWQADFKINSVALSLLSGCFFYTYVLVQVLAGFLYDYWGAKRVVRLAVFIFILGLLLFGLVHSFYLALVARALIGAGAGFAFVGMVYVAATWFRPNSFIVFVGLGELLSMLLTASGQWLAGGWVLHYGWRVVILGLSALGFIYFLVVLAFLRDQPHFKPSKHAFIKTFWQNFRMVLKFKQVWLAGVFGAGMFGVITIFASLWGSFFLQNAYHYTYLEATRFIALIPFGLALGGPLFGLLNERYLSPLVLLRLTAISLFMIILAIFLSGHVSFVLIILLSFMGFFGGANVLAFYIVEINVASHVRGIAVGFCNALNILLGTLFQFIIGLLFTVLHINSSSPPKLTQIAMLPFLLAVLLAFIAVCLLKKEN